MTLGKKLPDVRNPVPGEVGRDFVDRLAATECPAFTARRKRRAEATGAPHDPIVWTEALGANVVDADGNVYVDLTAGFGVASIGHRHPRVVEAVRAQSERLLHALGDVHPSDVKIRLLEKLASLAPFEGARTLLALNGADAIETALKTVTLASRKPGILAFEGGYHGLSHGPLAVSGYSAAFRAPFAEQLNPHVVFAPFPRSTDDVGRALDSVFEHVREDVGAILVEPILGRGGVHVPAPGFLRGLGERARERGLLVIADEIFVGLGRTGATFRSVEEGLVPDVLCIGKALGGGLPVSACIGRPEVMAAWGSPDGEAIHTGTFYGHPLGAAAALAALDVFEAEGLAARALEVGARLRASLESRALCHVREIRGVGLVLGVQLDAPGRALAVVRSLLERGFLALPAGADASVLQIVPPLTIDEPLLEAFVTALAAILAELP